MPDISLDTFQMGQKSPVRKDFSTTVVIKFQDYMYRDCSEKRRLRIWMVTHNLQTNRWHYYKYWTTQLPGEPHYVQAPSKIGGALRILIARDFPHDAHDV